MDFGNDGWRANLFGVLEAFGHRFGEASDDGEVPVCDLGDDPTLADSDVVTVTVNSELAFRLKQTKQIFFINFVIFLITL